jgi:hypothetical protein
LNNLSTLDLSAKVYLPGQIPSRAEASLENAAACHELAPATP